MDAHINILFLAYLSDLTRSECDNDILAGIDGFHMYHNSTSFNDLTSLLESNESDRQDSTLPAPQELTSLVPPEVAQHPTHQVGATTAAVPNNFWSSQKRQAEGPAAAAAAPPAKKKATAPRRNSTSSKKSNVTSNQKPTATVPTQKTSAKDFKHVNVAKGTPNPLTNTSHVAAAASGSKTPKFTLSKTSGISHNIKAVITNPPPLPPPTLPPPVRQQPVAIQQTNDATVPKPGSDAEYKNLAQAAITELMTNNYSDDANSECSYSFKVDTSTAHIKALTGNNWVAACAGASLGVGSVSSDSEMKGMNCNSSQSSNNRSKRPALTTDERAKQNRDRNREHARNTRLRKKAYVEELKHTLTELVTQRDMYDMEKRQSAQRELEQREVRFRVLEEFLKLRGRNETNFARWAAILEENSTFTLPNIDVKALQEGKLASNVEQTYNGVAAVMGNSANFNNFLQTMYHRVGPATFHHHCERKDFFMDGCNTVLEFTGNSIGPSSSSDVNKLTLRGLVRAKFSPLSNKLISATMTFDTSAIVTHIQRANSYIVSNPCDTSYDMLAAQVAANQADELLDSLQMPHIMKNVPSAVMVVNDSSSESSSEKGEGDSDESISEQPNQNAMYLVQN